MYWSINILYDSELLNIFKLLNIFNSKKDSEFKNNDKPIIDLQIIQNFEYSFFSSKNVISWEYQ